MRKKISSFAVAVTLLCLIPIPAFAYIDPNAGSLLFQIMAPITAIVVSAWLLAKEKFIALFKKLVALVRRRKP